MSVFYTYVICSLRSFLEIIMKPRRGAKKIPTCTHGHLLVEGNFTRMGERRVCRTCNVQACQRYTARKQSEKVLMELSLNFEKA